VEVAGVGGRSLAPSFWEVFIGIHDVRYRLNWAFLIEAIETGERALVPYRWEQIGSKQVTSSQMQMWSARPGVVSRVWLAVATARCPGSRDSV
jgi:hypothetical protein